MVRNMGVARDLGYLHVPGGLIVDVKALDDLPDDKIVLVCTGSQGEPMSALSRIANRDHVIRIGEGDTVILASSLIPGNENSVYRVINGLSRWGATVVHKANALVHVSGHASAGELLYVYNIVRPSNVMPVHGEWRHLRANADLAVLTGVPRDRTVLAEDGVVVDLVDGRASDRRRGAVRLRLRRRVERRRRHRVVAQGPADPARRGLHLGRRRRRLGDRQGVRRPGDPRPRLRRGRQRLRRRARPIEEALDQAASEGIGDSRQLEQLVRRTVGKWVSDTYRRRPMIIPLVVEV